MHSQPEDLPEKISIRWLHHSRFTSGIAVLISEEYSASSKSGSGHLVQESDLKV
jgi:hypothetical protein